MKSWVFFFCFPIFMVDFWLCTIWRWQKMQKKKYFVYLFVCEKKIFFFIVECFRIERIHNVIFKRKESLCIIKRHNNNNYTHKKSRKENWIWNPDCMNKSKNISYSLVRSRQEFFLLVVSSVRHSKIHGYNRNTSIVKINLK